MSGMCLGVIRIDGLRNDSVMEIRGLKKSVNESALRQFSRVERMDEIRVVKRMYISESVEK